MRRKIILRTKSKKIYNLFDGETPILREINPTTGEIKSLRLIENRFTRAGYPDFFKVFYDPRKKKAFIFSKTAPSKKSGSFLYFEL